MRSVFIHAGLPKCGSTALQFSLASNRGRMLEHNAFYPDNERDGVGHMPLCNDLVQAAKARSPSPMLRRMLDKFALSGAENLVLSSEGFAVRCHRYGEDALGGLLSELAVDVTVFVRRRDEWVRSHYKQSVKSVSRLYSGSLEDLVDKPPNFSMRLQPGFLAGTIERFARLVHAEKVHVVNLDIAKKGTPQLFGATIGIPLETFPGDASVLNGRKAIQFSRGLAINLAFSDTDTLFLAECNRRRLPRGARHAVRVALSEADTTDIAPNLRVLHPAMAERLLAEGAEDDARLAELFGAPVATFTPKLEQGADYRHALTRAEFAEIKARVDEKLAAIDAQKAKRGGEGESNVTSSGKRDRSAQVTDAKLEYL